MNGRNPDMGDAKGLSGVSRADREELLQTGSVVVRIYPWPGSPDSSIISLQPFIRLHVTGSDHVNRCPFGLSGVTVERNCLLKLFRAPLKFPIISLSGRVTSEDLQRIPQNSRTPQIVQASELRVS